LTGQTFDKERVHFNVAKLKKGGQNFEIDVDPNMAIAFKEGKNVGIADVLKVEQIFSDVKKGMLASETQMKQIFGTPDVFEVAKIIIDKGELPLTAEYKNKLREEKRKQIINIIHRNGVDPQTHIPHPPDRIANAMEEVKFKVDEFKPIQQQMQEALKKIRVVLPIKFEVKEIAIKIPAAYAAKSYSVVNSFGKILRDEWQKDGSWIVVLEMPAGLEEDFYDKVNAMCHGEIESKVLKIR